jgi:hypothetical protein
MILARSTPKTCAGGDAQPGCELPQEAKADNQSAIAKVDPGAEAMHRDRADGRRRHARRTPGGMGTARVAEHNEFGVRGDCAGAGDGIPTLSPPVSSRIPRHPERE